MASSWQRRCSGAHVLEAGPVKVFVRDDNSWTVWLGADRSLEGNGTSRYAARKNAIDAARKAVSEWSSALDRAAADLEPRP